MKKNFLLTIVVFLFTGGLSSFAQDITTGLKLHYTFDDVNAGLVPDHSGNGLFGTIMGAAAPTTGKVGQGLNLIDVNDYVQMPNDINTGITDFTFAAWVNFNAASGWGRVFDIGNGQEVNTFLCQTAGAYKFVVKQSQALGEQSVSGPAIVFGTWAHVAVTCSYNAEGVGTATMYINGVPVGTNTNFTNTLAGMGTTLKNYLGKSQYPDPTPKAVIDEFRMYNRALTVDDIMALNGVPVQLVSAFKALKLPGDLTQVTENITLPATIGNDGVTITWATNDSTVITKTGAVTRNQKYTKAATLTATLKFNEATINKTFDIVVLPIQNMSQTVAIWNFADGKLGKDASGNTTVTDESDNAYVATCKAGAQVVTIGKAEKVNVLSIKNGGEYFDFGTDIGEAIYGLKDYTVSVFFRKDTADGTNIWSGYGQHLYGFSNSISLSTDASGAMYYEPYRGRHVCTKDNYNSETSSFVGAGEPNTLLGTWHNITYSQTSGVGVLYYDGVEVARKNGGMPDPAVSLKRAGKAGTLYNCIGRPFYSGDPQLTETLIGGFNLYSVGLSGDYLDLVIGIKTNIAKLNEAYTSMTCNLYDLMALGDLLKLAKACLPFAYPGLADFQVAIAAAQKTYDDATVTPADIKALNDAIKNYKWTQHPTPQHPIDVTFAITNASFNGGTGGKLDPNSNLDSNPNGNGLYSYPEGWTVYLDHSGWCNAKFVFDDPAEGDKCYETWAATVRTFDVYQEIDLKAGYYIQSGQIRTSDGSPYTQHIYAMILPESTTYNSANLDSSKVITGDGWNSANNWQTLYNSFYCKGGKVRVGFKANGFMQFDNMKLLYSGNEMPSTPVANAGPNQTVYESEVVQLDGSASKDPNQDHLSYKWTAPEGISLSSSTDVKPTFTAPEVNEDTKITIGLVVNDGQVESPLDQVVITIKNKVSEPDSHFKVDFEGYGQDHMNLNILKATIDDLNLEAGDEIAAFDGNICCGKIILKQPIIFNDNNTYVTIAASKADDGKANGYKVGNAIKYKFWDISKGKELTVEAADYFNPNTGLYTMPPLYTANGSAFVKLSTISVNTRKIPLLPGWNIISSDVIPKDTNLKNIIQPLIDSGKLKKIMDESGKAIENFGAFGGWKNNIGNFSQTEGYKVNMNGIDTLYIRGEMIPLPIKIPLISGWNIISFPCQFLQDAQSVVNSLIDSGKLKKVMDESGKSIENYSLFGGWKNNIGYMVAGKGYKIYMTDADTLIIRNSVVSLLALRSSTTASELPASANFRNVFTGNGFDHMNINLVDLVNSGLQAGDEIGVFDGKICVGSTTVGFDQIKEGSISITASCNDGLEGLSNGFTPGHSITIRLFRNGEIYIVETEKLWGSVVFEKNGSLFAKVNLKTPQTRTFLEESLQFVCYPNPFKEDIKIDITNTEPTVITVEIYDFYGKKIKMLYNGLNNGKVNVKWDGTDEKGSKVEKGMYLCKALDQTIKIVYTGSK